MHGQEQHERGQQSQGAAVDRRIRWPSAQCAALVEEQGGDEEAAQHEEDIDAEEPTADPGSSTDEAGKQVVGEDGDDGKPAQSVEARDVSE